MPRYAGGSSPAKPPPLSSLLDDALRILEAALRTALSSFNPMPSNNVAKLLALPVSLTILLASGTPAKAASPMIRPKPDNLDVFWSTCALNATKEVIVLLIPGCNALNVPRELTPPIAAAERPPRPSRDRAISGMFPSPNLLP